MNGHSTDGDRPFLAGLAAARANLLPGAVIQFLMLALLLGYYFYPPTARVLNVLADWKQQGSFLFTFVVLGLAGGVLPELLRIVVFQRGAVTRANLLDMAFGIPFWGTLGCVTDAFYRCQAVWFGTEVSAAMLVKKVALDMIVFTPFWGTPAVVCGLEWRRSGFSPWIGRFFSLRFCRNTILPALIANWFVWVPAVTIIYSLPLLLQVPLFALTNSFWALLITYMARETPARTGPL